MHLALLLLVALLAVPAASACSLAHPRVGQVAATEAGLVWARETTIVRGEPGEEEVIGEAFPFPRFLASPDGATVLLARGEGLRGDCRVERTVVLRWTLDGTEDVSTLLPHLPLAVHWPSLRGVFADGENASIRRVDTGELVANVTIARSPRIGETPPAPPGLRAAAWSADGERLAIMTEEGVTLLDGDGRPLSEHGHHFPIGRERQARMALSPDGSFLAVAAMHGDRFTELGMLDARDPDGLRSAGGLLDARGVRALSWRDDQTLAVAWQGASAYGDAPRADAELASYDTALARGSSVGWAETDIGESLEWERGVPVVTLDGRIVRVWELVAGPEDLSGAPVVPATPTPRDLVPLGALPLAVGLALALALRRRA